MLTLPKRSDGSLSFVCEDNHFVDVLGRKRIVGLDKPHAGYLRDEEIEERRKRLAETKAIFDPLYRS